MFEQIIKKLGLDINDYSQWEHKNEKFKMHQLRRKIRYACFSMKRGASDDIPKKFIKYFKKQEHFATWELFGETWDVERADPTKTVPLTFSHNEVWEAKLRQILPELDGAISYKQSN